MIPSNYSQLFILLYGLGAFLGFLLGIRQTFFQKNPYGLTPLLLPYGIFVWGDAVILGLFWIVVSGLSLFLQSIQLFLIVQSVYWIVRSGGEVLYWFLQQFAVVKRDPPHTLWGQALFPGESIWFAYQLVWQVVLVISSISLLYLLGLFQV